jgi:hypothetical protein
MILAINTSMRVWPTVNSKGAINSLPKKYYADGTKIVPKRADTNLGG